LRSDGAGAADDWRSFEMYCVMWTYEVPPTLDEPAIRDLFAGVAGNYLGVAGLIRKYFVFTEDATRVIGIYVWETEAAAEAFYSDEWMAGVTERWGAAPIKQEWLVPVVAESAADRVVSERAVVR
jgi:hypothetical protein